MESKLKDSPTSIPISFLPLLSWIVQWIISLLQYVLLCFVNQYEEIERIHRTCVFIVSSVVKQNHEKNTIYKNRYVREQADRVQLYEMNADSLLLYGLYLGIQLNLIVLLCVTKKHNL